MAKTHRLVSASTAFVVPCVAGAPVVLAAAAGTVAALTASLPDQVEKPLRLPHRTVSHYPLVQLGVFSLPVLAAWHWMAAAVVLVGPIAASAWFSCLMHSVADAMTVDPRGVRLLWPLKRGFHVLPRRMRVRVSSKSTSEWVFFVVWSALVVCFIYARFRQEIPV